MSGLVGCVFAVAGLWCNITAIVLIVVWPACMPPLLPAVLMLVASGLAGTAASLWRLADR